PSGLRFVAARMDATAELLGEEALRIAEEIGGVAALAGEAEGKARVVVAVSKDKTGRCSASRLLGLLSPYIEGKGGGSDHLARGGGVNPAGIELLIKNVPTHLEQLAGRGG